MTDPDQRQLFITRLEEFSRQNSAGYRFRVVLVALLGYAYLGGVVLGLLGVVYVSLWLMIAFHQFNFILIKVLWIPLVLAWLVVRSMWISIPAPEGREIQREDAPALFDTIAEVRTTLDGPDTHHVLISDEFNAGIVQVPRFGMFGWASNYLVFGLPLMKAVGPEEFRAILAHEFGHLSGKHGKFSGWIYQLRQSWVQILTRVHQERHYASFLFKPFIDWYAPYFNAYSFVLARAQEYEADSYSVQMVGKTVAGRTLVQTEVKGRALQEELWGNFYRQANDQEQPPKSPFAMMLTELEQPLANVKCEKWLRQSLKVKTGYDDTHPALADRLAALGFDHHSLDGDSVVQSLAWTSDAGKENAADHYLKHLPEDFNDRFNRLWREQIAQTWKQTHDYAQKSRERLAELNTKSESEPLTIDEQWERARCVAETSEAAAAMPFVREIIRQDPDHVGAHFVLGVTLVEQQDASGIEYLEKVMQLNPSITGDACELIYNFYQEQGRHDEAETYRARLEVHNQQVERLREQATNLTVHDRFEPHDLDEIALKDLQDRLAKIRGLAAAYLVRKMAEGIEPFNVLAVFASYTWKHGRSDKHVADLIDELAAAINLGQTCVFVALDARPDLTDRLTSVARAEICMLDKEVGVELRH